MRKYASATDRTDLVIGFAERHERQDVVKCRLDAIESEMATVRTDEIAKAEIAASERRLSISAATDSRFSIQGQRTILLENTDCSIAKTRLTKHSGQVKKM